MLIPLILIQTLIFAGLVFFLRQILTKDVRLATQHLKQQEEEYAKKEAELKKKLSESQTYYEETLKKANDETGLTRTQSTREIQELRESTLEASRTQSEEIIQRANKTAEQIKLELTSNMEKKALHYACDLIQEALPVSLQKTIHIQWLKELVASKLDALDRMHLPEDLKEVEVKVAFPMGAEERTQLKKKLKEKLKQDVEIKEVEDLEIIAGMVICVGGIVLDGSLASRIRGIAHKHAESKT
jgi:hypothetical protein